MFIVKCAIPIGPKVVLLAVFTCSDFLIMSALSEMFVKNLYETQEHVAPVTNKAMIGPQS